MTEQRTHDELGVLILDDVVEPTDLDEREHKAITTAWDQAAATHKKSLPIQVESYEC